MKRLRRAGSMFGVVGLAMACTGVAWALQKTSQMPAPAPDYSGRQQSGNGMPRQSPFDEITVREMEEKRGKAINSERQRLMAKEANQLVQAAAELQVKVGQESGSAGRDDELRRAEMIEKLAKSVKDRMRGTR